MAKIHVYLQGKGGVGKSFAAAMYAQYKISKNQSPLCFDADPTNATLYSYKALKVTRVNIMEGGEINSRRFDNLMEQVATTKEDVIIDNGASSFVPLSHYLISNQVPTLLKEMGHELFIHTLITGGQAFLDTVNGFAQLTTQMTKEANFVVWLNPYCGPINYEGKTFEELKAYKDNELRVSAIIQIPPLKAETNGRDLNEMLQERLTFDEALALPSLPIMTRQRLKIIRDQIFNKLDKALIL